MKRKSQGTSSHAVSIREMYTLVARIWRYRSYDHKTYSEWHAEITIIKPDDPEIHRAVGIKNILRTIETYLLGKK